MSQETAERTPALTASQSSWRYVQAQDKEGWLGLMADDVLIEDPIGQSVHQPRRHRARGKDAVSAFYDATIATTNDLDHVRRDLPLELTPDEIAHILVLRFIFENGSTASVRGDIHVQGQRGRSDSPIFAATGTWT